MNTIITLSIIASLVLFFINFLSIRLDTTFCKLRYIQLGYFKFPRIHFGLNISFANALENLWENVKRGGKLLWGFIVSLVAVAILLIAVWAIAGELIDKGERMCMIIPLVIMLFIILYWLPMVNVFANGNEEFLDNVGGFLFTCIGAAAVLWVCLWMLLTATTLIGCAVVGIILVVVMYYLGGLAHGCILNLLS
mgnify:CR=1 FL=1